MLNDEDNKELVKRVVKILEGYQIPFRIQINPAKQKQTILIAARHMEQITRLKTTIHDLTIVPIEWVGDISMEQARRPDLPDINFWEPLTKDSHPDFNKQVFVGRYTGKDMECSVGKLIEKKETAESVVFYFDIPDRDNYISHYDFYAEIPPLPEKPKDYNFILNYNQSKENDKTNKL